LKGGHGIAGNDHSFHTSHIPESLAVPAVSSSPTLSVVEDSDPLLGEFAQVPAAPAVLLVSVSRKRWSWSMDMGKPLEVRTPGTPD